MSAGFAQRAAARAGAACRSMLVPQTSTSLARSNSSHHQHASGFLQHSAAMSTTTSSAAGVFDPSESRRQQRRNLAASVAVFSLCDPLRGGRMRWHHGGMPPGAPHSVRYFGIDAQKTPANAGGAPKSDAKVQEQKSDGSLPKQPSPSDAASASSSASASASAAATVPDPPAPPQSLYARFKDLYKRYWYVMVPVHVVTSTGWMAGFYYMSASGVDVPELLRSFSVSDDLVSRFEESKMGHLAIAYLCYKIATPVRYAVTVGGTTVSIKYLAQWGVIKPMPSNERLREMYDEKKAQMVEGMEEMKSKASDVLSGQKEEEEKKNDQQKQQQKK